MSNGWNPWTPAVMWRAFRRASASTYLGRVRGSCGDGWDCGSLTPGPAMSGDATKDELPKLHNVDEEGGESTVAMDAPVVPNGVPLPVSQPPPAAPPPAAGSPAPSSRGAIPLP